MRYVAGKGQGKGRDLFYFIITPDEITEILEGLDQYIVTKNSRVELNYKDTSYQEFFNSYKVFFEQILIGDKQFDKKEHWNIERPVRTSVIDDINKIKFEVIIDEKGNAMPYNRIIPTEPVINIDPFYLFWSAEQAKLSVAYINEPGIIGLRSSYPKYVSFNYTDYIDTTAYKSFTLYKTMVDRIKKISRKAKVETPVKLFKPNFWVSSDAVGLINKNRYLKDNKLEIK